MASYFVGESKTKAEEARDNVKKYHRDRQQILEKYVSTLIPHLDKTILEKSRKDGLEQFEFDYNTHLLTDADLKSYKVTFAKFTEDEHSKIRKNLVHHLEKEGFQVIKPLYESSFNRTKINICWGDIVHKEEDIPVTGF